MEYVIPLSSIAYNVAEFDYLNAMYSLYMDIVSNDDVKTFKELETKGIINIHHREDHDLSYDVFEYCPIFDAAVSNANNIMKYLISQNVSHCVPTRELDDVYKNSHIVRQMNRAGEHYDLDYDDCRSYCLHACGLNPIQYATILHGRDALVTTLLRHEYISTIRRGFDSLYFRVFRKSFAPGKNAAKRAKLEYSIEFDS
jgi:hypothetical protein